MRADFVEKGLALGTVIVLLLAGLAACGGSFSLSEAEAVDAAWQALEPNTSSHDRANWEVGDVRQVRGEDVAIDFEGGPAPGCWQGPTPPANESIRDAQNYWYVQMQPRPATPVPQQGEISPTAPPNVPEAFMYRALFLFDAGDGHLVARKLYCVIY
jgi:hypothetical protein